MKYSEEDVRAFIKRFYTDVVGGVFQCDRNGNTMMLVFLEEYDNAVEDLLDRIGIGPRCLHDARCVLFTENIENLPTYIGTGHSPSLSDTQQEYCAKIKCEFCGKLAKWRLEQGK